MIVCGFTRVDGLIRTVCPAIPTSTIQEVEQQLVVALEMPEVVLLVVVVVVAPNTFCNIHRTCHWIVYIYNKNE